MFFSPSRCGDLGRYLADFRGDGRPAAGACVIAGIVARLVQYAWQRAYWHDESFLVLNIFARTLPELFGPLDMEQAAPPMFLAVERGTLRLANRNTRCASCR